MHWHYQYDAADAIRTLWRVAGVSNQIAIHPKADAEDIKSDIMAALRRSWFSPGYVDMSVNDGKVTLTGTVANWVELALAGSTA